MSGHENKTYALKIRLFPLVFVSLTVSFFVVMITAVALSDVAGAAIPIGMIMGPPALFLTSLGVTLACIRVRVDSSAQPPRIKFRLPHAGSAPLTPNMIHRRDLSIDEISRIDVVLRPNTAAIGGFERLYHFRTSEADFYFNSMWFSNWQTFDDFLNEQKIPMLVGSPDEIMDAVGDAASRPRYFEGAMRGCGWVMGLVLALIVLLGGLAAFSPEPGDRKGGITAAMIGLIGLGVVRMLMKYRHVK